MISRRMVFAGAAGVSAVALTGCAGALPTPVDAFLKTVSATLQSVANGLSGVLSQISSAVGVTVPAALVGQITSSLNLISQVSAQVSAAGENAAATLLQNVQNYITIALNAAKAILALPGVSALPFAGTISTAISVASMALPYLVLAVQFVQGLITTPPSTTAAVPIPAPTTAGARRFGTPPANVRTIADMTNYMNALAQKP